jgi:hypothetical protein
MTLKDIRIEFAKLLLELERLESEKHPVLPDAVLVGMENLLRDLRNGTYKNAK